MLTLFFCLCKEFNRVTTYQNLKQKARLFAMFLKNFVETIHNADKLISFSVL